MKRFSDREVIDFILNDSFVQWASGATDADQQHWLQWIAAHPENTEAFNQAKEIVLRLKIKPVGDLTSAEVDNLINEVLQKNNLLVTGPALKQLTNFNLRRQWLKIAASVLLFIATSFLLYHTYQLKSKKDALNVAANVKLIIRSNDTSSPIWIRLPDKTSVILKPGSQLKYPETFASSKREVYLSGEAFFEVTKNPNRPFFVYAGEMTTRVLGTSFTVQAFKGDKHFKVIVNTGKVAVFATTGGNKSALNKASILVVPNQQATFFRKEVVLVKDDLKKPLPLSPEVSKVLFNFNETPLSQVIETIRKAYGVTINYNEKNLSNCPLTASLTDQPLYEKLDLICKAIEAHYAVNDGEIYIDGTGCHN